MFLRLEHRVTERALHVLEIDASHLGRFDHGLAFRANGVHARQDLREIDLLAGRHRAIV